jgi:peroxiredoxin
MSSQNLLESGDHAPWFTAPVISGSSQFAFNTIAGRYVLLLFFGSAEFEAAAEALRMVRQAREHFDDECACFFGVSVDPQDEAQGRIARELPGIRFFLDYDRRVSSRFGAVDGDRYLPHWLLLRPLAPSDGALRIG